MPTDSTHHLIENNRRTITFVAYAVTAISVFGASAISPVLPMIGRDLEVSDADTSLLISMFVLPMAVLTPMAGFLAKKISLKSLLIASLLLYVVGAVSCYTSHGFISLVCYRIVQGVGAAALELFGLVMLIDITPSKLIRTVMGRNAAVIGVSTAMAPIVSGVLALVSWRATFLPALLAFPLAIRVARLKFPRAHSSVNKNPARVPELLLSRKSLISFALIFISFFFLFGFLLSFVPALARANGVTSPLWESALPALSAISISLVAPMSSRMFHHGNGLQVVILGLMAYTFAMFSYVMSSNYGVVLLLWGCLLTGAGHGLLFPLAQSLMAEQAPEKNKVLFMSVNITSIGASQAVAPIITSSIAATLGLIPAFIVAGCIGVICILVVLGLAKFIPAQI